MEGLIIPVVITVYNDRSFTFITKTPPASILLKRAAGIAKGSGTPNKDKVGKVTAKQVEDIAKQKMPDLNAASVETAIKSVAARPARWASKSLDKLRMWCGHGLYTPSRKHYGLTGTTVSGGRQGK